MNEFLREFVMTTINEMIDAGKAEWEVRKYALDWYTKGVLTQEDLQEIAGRYKKPEPEPEPVEKPTEDANIEENASNEEQDAEMQVTEETIDTEEEV